MRLGASVVAAALATTALVAAPRPATEIEISVPQGPDTARIDGRLDEPVWRGAAVVELPFEIDPGENLPARVRTECLLAATPAALLIGCRAFDPEPSAIRAHFTDRDGADSDDWILLSLDTFFDRRRAFEFRVNPLGVQMDSTLNELGGGGVEIDGTWDAIWESAGRITADGFEVEIALPFTSLRFPHAAPIQRWGFLAMRHWPRRLAYFFRQTPWNRDRACTLCENVPIGGFRPAAPGHDLELDPTVTTSRTDLRSPGDDALTPGEFETELGLSARWGLGAGFGLNAALNPDFSQVEADAVQLDVNTRFALFYPEKRPFFLEGADLLRTPVEAVYTRTVADPAWGGKFSGKHGRHAVALVVADDDVTNLVLPANQGSTVLALDAGNRSTVARWRIDLGRQSSVGMLFTDRDGEDGYGNRVFGLDGLIRLAARDTVQVQALRSETGYPAALASDWDQPTGSFSGSALSLAYRHEARDWNWSASFLDLGRDFRADAGFVPRVDTRTAALEITRWYWPEEGDAFSRIGITLEAARTEDHVGTLTDRSVALSGEWRGPLLSTVVLGVTRLDELFAGMLFDQWVANFDGSVRPSAALALGLGLRFGDAVDYAGARPARIARLVPSVSAFLGRHLQLALTHTREELEVDGGRLYRASATQARVVYQFDTRTFLRAIVQQLDVARDPALYPGPVESGSRNLFGQLLLAYKINPQTVVFVGYSGSRDDVAGAGLEQRDRTLFVKVGYAWLL